MSSKHFRAVLIRARQKSGAWGFNSGGSRMYGAFDHTRLGSWVVGITRLVTSLSGLGAFVVVDYNGYLTEHFLETPELACTEDPQPRTMPLAAMASTVQPARLTVERKLTMMDKGNHLCLPDFEHGKGSFEGDSAEAKVQWVKCCVATGWPAYCRGRKGGVGAVNWVCTLVACRSGSGGLVGYVASTDSVWAEGWRSQALWSCVAALQRL